MRQPARRSIKPVLLIITTCLISILQVNGQQSVTFEGKNEQPDYVKSILQKDGQRRSAWWWGWLGGYSAATAGQLIAGISSNKLSFRQDMYLGAATTLVGAAGQFFSPVSPPFQPAGTQIYSPGGSPGQNEQLANAEEMLKEYARLEAEGRSWKMHALSGAVNLSSGLITWLGFKRTWKDGLLNFAFNTAITEAQIWSQPMLAHRTYTRYMINNQKSSGSLDNKKSAINFSVKASPNCFSLCLSF